MIATMNALAPALQLTREMLAAARALEWDRLMVLEVEREPLLLRQHATDAASQAQLGEILAYDRQLHTLVARARDAVAAQWQLEHDRTRAIAAYAQP
jgi:hypothetical protein